MAEETVQITAILKDKFSRQSTTISKSIKGLDKNLANLSKTLQPLSLNITALGTALAGLTLSKLAADAEETASKFEAVFKDLSDTTNVFIDDLANAVGRNRTELRGFLATLQDTFVPLGFARDQAAELSKELVTLAIDVASFNNQSDATVIRDFQSALVGNTESVRKYGIVLTQARLEQEAINAGFEDGLKGLSEAEKAQLRFNVILDATTDAQGDAVRTQDSFQNSLKKTVASAKELGEELGTVLNEQIRPFLVEIGNTLTAMAQWARENKATIQTVIQFGTALVVALAALKGFLIIRALIPVMTSLSAVIGATTSGLVGMVASMASLATGGGKTAAAMLRNATAIKTFRRGLTQLKGAIRGVGIGLLVAGVTEAVFAIQAVNNSMKNLTDTLADSTKSFAEIQEQIGITKENLVDLSESVNPFKTLSGQTITAANRLEELIALEDTLIETNNILIRSAVNVARSLRQQADQTSRTTQEQNSLRDAAAGVNAILAQQGDVAENARIALQGNANELIKLFEKAIISEKQLLALTKQRSVAIQETVQGYLDAADAAAKLANNEKVAAGLFDKFAQVQDRGEAFEIFSGLEELKGAEDDLARLGAQLDKIAETGDAGEFKFAFEIEGTDETIFKLDTMAERLEDLALDEFFTREATKVRKFNEALDQTNLLTDLNIEKRRLLGEITDEEAAGEQQALKIKLINEEIAANEKLLTVTRNQLAVTSASSPDLRKDLNKEVNTLLAKRIELNNDLLRQSAEITNADLTAANGFRDSFTKKAEALQAFIVAQQKAVDTGTTTFKEAQQAVIDKQKELQTSFEETTLQINQTFGEGSELALQYNEALTETNLKTQELAINSENAFTTLDRVLQQTTATLVGGLTSSMTGFFESIITGSKDGKQAFGDLLRDMAKNFATFAAATIAKLLIIKAISAFIPGGFAAQSVGQGVATGSGFNSGGMVGGGASGPDRDSVPAMLTTGEYVIPRSRVKQYGAGVMNALRQGKVPASMLRGFSSGTIASRGNSLAGGGQATDGSVGLEQSGEGLVLPVMQADDNNLETILNGGESAMMRYFERNNTQIKSVLDSSER